MGPNLQLIWPVLTMFENAPARVVLHCYTHTKHLGSKYPNMMFLPQAASTIPNTVTIDFVFGYFGPSGKGPKNTLYSGNFLKSLICLSWGDPLPSVPETPSDSSVVSQITATIQKTDPPEDFIIYTIGVVEFRIGGFIFLILPGMSLGT